MSPAKVVSRICGNELPRDNNFDLVTIHHSSIDGAHVGIAHPYKFSGLADSPHTLESTVIADMYVWDNCEFLLEHVKVNALNWISHVYVDAVYLYPILITASVASNVQPAKLENSISGSGPQRMASAKVVI